MFLFANACLTVLIVTKEEDLINVHALNDLVLNLNKKQSGITYSVEGDFIEIYIKLFKV
jgi:hypothetical protein